MQNFISIPKPCHENWKAMTPQEQGRLCAKCNIVVKDFSSMSNEEIMKFLNKKAGRICGRVNDEQLNKPIALNEKLKKFLYAFAIIFLPLIPFSLFAQTNSDTSQITNQLNSGSLEGRIIDEKGEPVPFAIITIMQVSTSIRNNQNRYDDVFIKDKCKSNFNGKFVIKHLPAGRYALKISSVGLQTTEISQIIIKESRSTIQNITLFTKNARCTTGIIIRKTESQIDPQNPGNQEVTGDEIRGMIGGHR